MLTDKTDDVFTLHLPRRGVSLAALIDVVFLLLIFFMVVTSFTDLRVIHLNATEREGTVATTGDSITLRLDSDGRLFYDGQAYEQRYQDVARLVAERVRADDSLRLTIVLAAWTPVHATVRLLDHLENSALANIDLTLEEDFLYSQTKDKE